MRGIMIFIGSGSSLELSHFSIPTACLAAMLVKVDFNQDGSVARLMGDCYPTEFRLNPLGSRTTWSARLDRADRLYLQQEWIDVPDNKIIREKNPDPTGRDAHLCTGPGVKILCAVPSTGVQ